jgi:hypothetical protein
MFKIHAVSALNVAQLFGNKRPPRPSLSLISPHLPLIMDISVEKGKEEGADRKTKGNGCKHNHVDNGTFPR